MPNPRMLTVTTGPWRQVGPKLAVPILREPALHPGMPSELIQSGRNLSVYPSASPLLASRPMQPTIRPISWAAFKAAR